MRAQLCLSERRLRPGFFQDGPLRSVLCGSQKEKLCVFARPPEMFKVRAGQTAAADKSVTGSPRPPGFKGQRPHAVTQSHLLSDHRCGPDFKPVIVLLVDLNA